MLVAQRIYGRDTIAANEDGGTKPCQHVYEPRREEAGSQRAAPFQKDALKPFSFAPAQ